MIHLDILEQDEFQIEFERYNHPHVQQKMWVTHLITKF